MKKLLKLLTVTLMLFLIPNVLKAAEVSIENITLVEHSDLVAEKSPATANGLNVNFDLSFTNLNDYAKYKVVINNPTNTEYEIEKETDFTTSEYVQYTYSYEGESKVLKANSKITMYITLTYKKEVPAESLQEGKYVETNKLTVNLSNGTTNPKTADASTIVLSVLTLMLIGSLVIYKYTNRKEYLGTLAITIALIPITLYAAEKLKLNVETKITVEEKFRVSYYAYEMIKKSEESKYNIFQTIDFGDQEVVDNNNDGLMLTDISTRNYCFPTSNDEYEVCMLEIAVEAYAPGETVNLLESVTTHGIDENNNFVEGTLVFDGEKRYAWLVDLEDSIVWKNDRNRSLWVYDSDYNNGILPDFTPESIYDDFYDDEYNEGSLLLKTPGTFTMPDRDVYFYTENYVVHPN